MLSIKFSGGHTVCDDNGAIVCKNVYRHIYICILYIYKYTYAEMRACICEWIDVNDHKYEKLCFPGHHVKIFTLEIV